MKKTKTTLYTLVSLIFIVLSTAQSCLAQSLLSGLFHFSKNTDLSAVNINMYHCGKTISTQKHTNGIPKITYEIPKYNDQTTFYLLITPTAPHYSLKQFEPQEEGQNTIDYLTVNNNEPYLFYTLEYQDNHWDITQSTLPENGKFPDSTIIVTYFPDFIKAIKGGNQLELPTIYVDASDINLFGSEENFVDASIKLQLTSLDLKALHVPTKQKIQTDSCRVLIMDTIT